MKLRIANNFTLPAEAVTQTFAILGIRGSGKTNTGVVLAEELLEAKQQVVIIDPVDVWWGLKSSFPIPVIGGEHADVPLEGGAGVVLADFVVETRASVILSLAHLSMNDQRRFAGDFAKRFYLRKAPTEYRTPVMVIVDEADEFVPQRIPHGHEEMFGAFDRLARRARVRGVGLTLISQRPQVVNKDVLTQIETLVAMRLLHKLDRKAVEAWIEAHDTAGRKEEFLASLASLDRGEAWIWSPSWLNVFQRVQVRARNTFDSSATPKAGERIRPPKELAPVDLEKLRTSMAAQIEKAKADDPKALRAELANLRAENAELRAKLKKLEAAPAPAATSRAAADKAFIERALKAARAKVVVEAQREYSRSIKPALRAFAEGEALIRRVTEALRDGKPPESLTLKGSEDLPAAVAPARPQMDAFRPPAPMPQRAPRAEASANGVGGALRVLKALAQRHPLRVTRRQLATLAGLAPTGGTFSTYYSRLRTAGYLDEQGGLIGSSAAGLEAAAVEPAQPQSTEELLAMWRSNVGGAGRMLDALARHYPRPVSREDLAAELEMAAGGGTFSTYLSRLRSNGLAEVQGQMVKASDTLFNG